MSVSPASKVSVIIPTLNRPDFLLRTLRYYADAKFSGRILVGDSSGPEHVARVRAFLRDVPSLDVTYAECPGLNDRNTLLELANRVETPYAVFQGDDDVFLPGALAQCVECLDGKPEFASARGRAWLFTVDANGAYGRLGLGGPYRLPAPTAETPLARLQQLLGHYAVTLFSVHRSAVWRAMWRDVDRIRDRAFGAEILPCTRSAVYGRCATLEVAYLLRQVHPARYHLPGKTEWRGSPGWDADFAFVCSALADEVREASGGLETPGGEDIAAMFERTYLARRKPGVAAHGASRAGARGLRHGVGAMLERWPAAGATLRRLQSGLRLARTRSALRGEPAVRRELDLFVSVASRKAAA